MNWIFLRVLLDLPGTSFHFAQGTKEREALTMLLSFESLFISKSITNK